MSSSLSPLHSTLVTTLRSNDPVAAYISGMSSNRVPSGVPAGGEFAAQCRTESGVSLIDTANFRPTTNQPRRGYWVVYDPEVVAAAAVGPYAVKVDSNQEQKDAAAAVSLAAARRLSDSVMAPELLKDLARKGEPMTLLTVSDTGLVSAVEGVGRFVNGEPILVRKGSDSEGWRIWSLNIVDCEPGWGGKLELSRRFGVAFNEIAAEGLVRA